MLVNWNGLIPVGMAAHFAMRKWKSQRLKNFPNTVLKHVVLQDYLSNVLEAEENNFCVDKRHNS